MTAGILCLRTGIDLPEREGWLCWKCWRRYFGEYGRCLRI